MLWQTARSQAERARHARLDLVGLNSEQWGVDSGQSLARARGRIRVFWGFCVGAAAGAACVRRRGTAPICERVSEANNGGGGGCSTRTTCTPENLRV
jgi:hypothetical protein